MTDGWWRWLSTTQISIDEKQNNLTFRRKYNEKHNPEIYHLQKLLYKETYVDQTAEYESDDEEWHQVIEDESELDESDESDEEDDD